MSISIHIRLWKICLNVVLIGLKPTLTVICVFIHILLVCLVTYYISIIRWLCHTNFEIYVLKHRGSLFTYKAYKSRNYILICIVIGDSEIFIVTVCCWPLK